MMATTLEVVGFGIIGIVGLAVGFIMNNLTKRVEKLENGKTSKEDLEIKLQNTILQVTVTINTLFKTLETAIDKRMKVIEDAILLMKNNIKKREDD